MAERKDNDGVIMFPPGVFFGGLAVGFAVWWFWPVPILPSGWSFALRVVGVIAIALGFAAMFWALGWFMRIKTTPTHWEPTTALAAEGPYRFTRNPMYVGMALVQAGIALCFNALWPLLTLVPVLVIIRVQVIAREEAYLEAKFGSTYRDFKGRVRRWL
jgi:protein-S-isoprenylcysteine O-methyltransferase Ste14